ncbi:Fic family protein [Candidatus Cyanaurora vandensis]|uniref:Fic family protein n=1 Tax=Candidatus Cyanaurora vandensis TaxID=2714958 RepID=UPI00257E4A90|nr:Fic family protein [Candidatus Cyanaurora vandensis]
MSINTKSIWKIETGITDIDIPWKKLAASEIESIKNIWAEQKKRLQGTSQLTKFTERLSREWAIETGIIENLYQIDRGIIQTLIERGFQAEFLTHGSTNKSTSYVLNLLRDQQNALEGIFNFITQRRELSTSYIKELHAALLHSQSHTDAQDTLGNLTEIPLIKGTWKTQPNYPTRDGVLITYCPPEQVASEMDRLVAMHHAHRSNNIAPEVEAAWLHHRFSQIHPFQDGSGRVCRALASMILVRADLFPLVVTRDDKNAYLDALEAADHGDLKPLVDLFATLQRVQFRKATALSENILSTGVDIVSVMDSLLRVAKQSKASLEQERYKVLEHAKVLESDTESYLEQLVPNLQQVLQSVSSEGNALVRQSNSETDHYFRAQIIENARNYLKYFADTLSYKSWVSLNMFWERRAYLVFAFHGIGRPFTGSLVCAPFLKFRDTGEDEKSVSIFPVADEAFIFFYNEPLDRIQERFQVWREKVVLVALQQLGENL